MTPFTTVFQYRCFFVSPEIGSIGGAGGSTVHSNISKVNMNLKESRTALTVYIMQFKKEENRWKERGKRKGEEILK